MFPVAENFSGLGRSAGERSTSAHSRRRIFFQTNASLSGKLIWRDESPWSCRHGNIDRWSYRVVHDTGVQRARLHARTSGTIPYGGAFSMNSPGFELSSSALSLFLPRCTFTRMKRTVSASREPMGDSSRCSRWTCPSSTLTQSSFHRPGCRSPTRVLMCSRPSRPPAGTSSPSAGRRGRTCRTSISCTEDTSPMRQRLSTTCGQSVPGPPTILLIGVGIVGLVVVRGYRATSNFRNPERQQRRHSRGGVSTMWQ